MECYLDPSTSHHHRVLAQPGSRDTQLQLSWRADCTALHCKTRRHGRSLSARDQGRDRTVPLNKDYRTRTIPCLSSCAMGRFGRSRQLSQHPIGWHHGCLLMAIGNTGACCPVLLLSLLLLSHTILFSRGAYEHTNKVVVNSY